MRDDATGDSASPESEARLDRLIARQRTAAFRAAIPFAVFLLAFPLAARFLPMPLAWLTLAIFVYPFTWIIANGFVRAADAEERDEA